jgi:hypothetical protein
MPNTKQDTQITQESENCRKFFDRIFSLSLCIKEPRPNKIVVYKSIMEELKLKFQIF